MRVLSDEYKASIDRRMESSADEHLLFLLPYGEALYEIRPDHAKVVYAFNKLKAEIEKRGIEE